jgi:hypothetical protein
MKTAEKQVAKNRSMSNPITEERIAVSSGGGRERNEGKR